MALGRASMTVGAISGAETIFGSSAGGAGLESLPGNEISIS